MIVQELSSLGGGLRSLSSLIGYIMVVGRAEETITQVSQGSVL